MANLDELKEILDRLPEENAKEILELANKRANKKFEELEKDKIFPVTGEFTSSTGDCTVTAKISEEDKYNVSVTINYPENEPRELKFTRKEFENLVDVFKQIRIDTTNKISKSTDYIRDAMRLIDKIHSPICTRIRFLN